MRITTTHIVITVGVLVAGFGGFMLFNKRSKDQISSSLDGSGSPTSSLPKGDSVTEPNWNAPFDMNYTKEVERYLGRSVRKLDVARARVYAQRLESAKGFFIDDTDTIAAIFGKELKDKIAVSQVSEAFWRLTKGKDLWKYLTSFLSSNELTKYIRRPLKNLPNYRTL